MIDRGHLSTRWGTSDRKTSDTKGHRSDKSQADRPELGDQGRERYARCRWQESVLATLETSADVIQQQKDTRRLFWLPVEEMAMKSLTQWVFNVQCGMNDAIVSPIDRRSLTCRGLAQPYRPRIKTSSCGGLEQLSTCKVQPGNDH